MAIGDVTCDGRSDVVMTTTYYFDAANDYRVFVFPQLEDGSLGAPVSYPYSATANRNGIVLADLSEDGCLDVVVGHGKGISVLLADPATGGLRSAVVVTDGDANTLSAMDVNRDGHLDIISLGWSRGASIFYGNGAGAFSQITQLATNASGYNDHEVGDLNGDGVPDLAVMSGQSTPSPAVHLHNGTNALSTTPRTYSGQRWLANGIGLGDVNGDGRGDVVLSTSSTPQPSLLLMVQDANGDLVGPTSTPSYSIPESVQVADLDRDGDDDVVVLHGGWVRAGVYLQEAGALLPETLYPIPYASHYAPQGLALGDVSGDGCADIAIADYNSGLVMLRGICPPSQCETAEDGAVCDDGNACTRMDTCQAGACVGANPVTCTAQDQCHAVGTCDPASGICSNPNKDDGSGCNDGNACTQADTCQAGACVGASPVTCTAQDQCHEAGTCDPASGTCSNPSKEDGSACNDSNACTQVDACQAGTCVGANPVTCTAQDQCHAAGTCDPASGTCSNPNKDDGSGCNDGNACTREDSCQEGACVGASPVTCTAQDQCHAVGTCDPTSGTCSNPSKADGSGCNDGNACTQADTCQAGACVGASPVTCTAQDQCHEAGTCDPASGTCSNPNKDDGSGCNDGNACTQADTCQAGACVGANPVTCTAQDQCHAAGTCDPASGTCSNPNKDDGVTCDEGTCNAGTCVPTPDEPSDGGTGGLPGEGKCGCGATGAPYLDLSWIGVGLLFVFRRRVLGTPVGNP